MASMVTSSLGFADVKKEDTEALQYLTDLLHLFHHRNKNQHRRSIWWRHFSVFRKQLNKVTSDLFEVQRVPNSHVERTRKKAKCRQIFSLAEQRLEFWRDVLVPKWQHAFSQVAADGRFSVLGLVLLSALAEACRILQVTTAFEELGQQEVEKVLHRFAEEGWDDITAENDQAALTAREDVGEVIMREDETSHERPASVTTTLASKLPKPLTPSASPALATKPVKRSTETSTKPKTNKRKSGNAIDDLFSGLG